MFYLTDKKVYCTPISKFSEAGREGGSEKEEEKRKREKKKESGRERDRTKEVSSFYFLALHSIDIKSW